MGDRLAASDDINLKKEAEICYICSGNINKAVEASDSDIQETVELVTMLQKALEFHTTRKVNIEGNIATVLTCYAEMLASEGDLDAALSYLGNSQEPRITMLRDRVYKALGHIQMEPQRSSISRNTPYSQQNMYAQNHALPRKSLPGTAQSMFTPVQPNPAPIQPPQVPSWNTAPTKQPYGSMPNQSFNNPGVITNQPYGGGIQPTQFNPSIPAPPLQSHATDPYTSYGQPPMSPAVPPPPPSGANQGSSLSGSRPPSVGPHSKSKYIIDPSVKSGPTYGTTGFSQNQMYGASQPQAFPTPGSFPTQAPYHPQQPQTMAAFGGYGSGGAQNTIYNPAEPELQQKPPVQPGLLNPSPVKPQAMYDPTTAAQSQNVGQPQSGNYPNENVYQPGSQTSGWNDPPISKSAKSQTKSEFQRQDPIMHPLRGAASQPEPTVYQQESMYQPQQHQRGYQDPQAMYNQYNQNIPAQGVPGVQQFNRPMEPLPPVQPAQIVRAPEPEKPKAPIPEEHVQLQTIFNELKDRCFEKAKDPQTKRKIDDVTKKLEVFYDYLREQKISQNTLQGLHQICNHIQTGNYQEGLSVHTQLVSGPDFSLIASFMLGIKVLLQVALRSGVYIR